MHYPESQSSQQRVENILDEDVGRVLGPDTPGLQESEARLQEEHHAAVDEDEESVDGVPDFLELILQ